jgi:hypothetical protein
MVEIKDLVRSLYDDTTLKVRDVTRMKCSYCDDKTGGRVSIDDLDEFMVKESLSIFWASTLHFSGEDEEETDCDDPDSRLVMGFYTSHLRSFLRWAFG